MKDDGTFELGEKLTEDDHGHLRARWDVTGLRRNAQNLGVNPETAIRAEFWSYDEYEAALADAEAAKAAEADAASNDRSGADGSVPVRAYADAGLLGKPYADWTKEQLKAEVDKRNSDRADWADYAPMSASGNKSELAKTLSEDDAEDAADSE